jgi:hypothetical protein
MNTLCACIAGSMLLISTCAAGQTYDPIAKKRQPSAPSEIAKFTSPRRGPVSTTEHRLSALPPRGVEHRAGCNFDNTICEK